MTFDKFGPAFLVAALSACGVSYAQEVQVTSAGDYDDPGPVYVELTGGVAQSVNVGGFEADGELAVGGAVGVRFGDEDGVGLRLQGELNRVEASAFGVINGDVTAYGGSVLLDVPLGDHLTIAGGGGLEYADGAIDNGPSADGDGWHYVVQGEYELTERLALAVGYRNTSLDFDGLEVDTETLFAGLRFRPF